MISVTAALREALMSETLQRCNILVYKGSNLVKTISSENVVAGGLSIDRYSASGNSIEIGSAISSEMTLKLNNHSGTYDDFDFEGCEFTVRVSVVGSTALCTLGKFIADRQPRRQSVITITALDNMVKFDKNADPSQITFPITVRDLVGRICTLCDVSLYSTTFTHPNYDYVIKEFPYTSQVLTYRNLIQYCAELMGTCAWIDNIGRLTFSWYTATGFSVDKTMRYSSDIYENNITVTGVKHGDLISGTEGYVFDVSGNPLVTYDEQTVIDNIAGGVVGTSYRPYSMSVTSAPFLLPMDKITFVDKDGANISTIITHINYTMNDSTYIKAIGETSQERSYSKGSGLTQSEALAIDKIFAREIKGITIIGSSGEFTKGFDATGVRYVGRSSESPIPIYINQEEYDKLSPTEQAGFTLYDKAYIKYLVSGGASYIVMGHQQEGYEAREISISQQGCYLNGDWLLNLENILTESSVKSVDVNGVSTNCKHMKIRRQGTPNSSGIVSFDIAEFLPTGATIQNVNANLSWNQGSAHLIASFYSGTTVSARVYGLGGSGYTQTVYVTFDILYS